MCYSRTMYNGRTEIKWKAKIPSLDPQTTLLGHTATWFGNILFIMFIGRNLQEVNRYEKSAQGINNENIRR